MKHTTLPFRLARRICSSVLNALAVFLLLAWSSSSEVRAAVLVGWDFNLIPVNSQSIPGPIEPDLSSSGVIFGGLTRGAGVNQFLARNSTTTNNLSTVMRFENGVTSRTREHALSRDVYVEFSLAPAAGHRLNVENLTMDGFSASGTNSRNFFVLYSMDNFATSTLLIPDTVATVAGVSVQGDLNLTDVTTPVQFRIYGYAPSDTSQPNRALQYDNIFVNGTVVPIPEPTSTSLVCLGVVGLLMRRRRSPQKSGLVS
jgi:hypothetical protein